MCISIILIPLYTFFEWRNNFYFLYDSINKILGIDLRQIGINHINSIHGNINGSYINLILFNFKNQNNLDFYNNLSKLSLVHLIVIGGFHVNLVCLFLKKIPKLGPALVILVSFIFAYMNKFSVSTTRTLVYFILINLKSKIFQKNAHAISIIILEIISPYSVNNSGLILSYVCIRSLSVANKFKVKNKLSNFIITASIVSMYNIPILGSIELKVSLWSILFSIIATPLITIFYIASIFISWFEFSKPILDIIIKTLEHWTFIMGTINVQLCFELFKNDYFLLSYFLWMEIFFWFLLERRKHKWYLNELKNQ